MSPTRSQRSQRSCRNCLTTREAVCDEIGCREEQIREKGRKGNEAQEIATYFARDLAGSECKDLRGVFSGISSAAITMIYNQATSKICRDKRLKGKVNKIKGVIFHTTEGYLILQMTRKRLYNTQKIPLELQNYEKMGDIWRKSANY